MRLLPLNSMLLLACVPFALGQTVDKPLQLGGDVTAPKLIYQVDPDFPEAIRKKAASGKVVVSVVVDEHGSPQKLQVVRSPDLRVNPYILEAVRQYRFRPAQQNGTPVAVEMNVLTVYQIF